MKNLLKLSLRNVFRQKRRSGVTILASAMGVLGLAFYLSLMNGMVYEMVHAALDLRLPAISIEKQEKGNLAPFTLTGKDLDWISRIPGVQGISGRLRRDGLVTSADLSVTGLSQGVRIYGVEPGEEPSVTKVRDYIDGGGEGHWLTDDYDPDFPSVVIGSELAKKLRVRLGDVLIVTVLQTIQEESREHSVDARAGLEVVGIYRSADTTFEKGSLFVHHKFLEAFQQKGEHPVHQLALRMDTTDVKRVAEKLREHFRNTDLTVETWKEKDPFLASNIKVFDVFNVILLFLVLFASSFVVVNTMLMVVQERFREFGILKAIGAGPVHTFFMILLESIFLGVSGILGGFLVSLPLVGLLFWTGLDLGIFSTALGTMGIPSVLHPFLRYADIGMTVGYSMIFSALGGLIPATRAARIRPLDAIHFE